MSKNRERRNPAQTTRDLDERVAEYSRDTARAFTVAATLRVIAEAAAGAALGLGVTAWLLSGILPGLIVCVALGVGSGILFAFALEAFRRARERRSDNNYQIRNLRRRREKIVDQHINPRTSGG